MTDNATKTAYFVAIAAGIALWLAATALGGRREAWDSSLYWAVAYPVSILLAGGLGYWVPIKPWRWGLAVMLSQAVALAFVSSSFSMLPLGLILFAVLALPPIGLAKLAAKFRLRNKEK